MGIHVSRIAHSSKLRARQTAEIFRDAFDPAPELEELDLLKATKNPAKAAKYVANAGGDVMLVGHRPHLPRLTSFLILGKPDREIVAFRKGAINALDNEEDGWRLAWILTPEMAAVTSEGVTV